MRRTATLKITLIAMPIMVRPVRGPLRHLPSAETRLEPQTVKPFWMKTSLPLVDQTRGEDNVKRIASETGMHMLIWPTRFKLRWETCTMNVRETNSPARLTMDTRMGTSAMSQTDNPMAITFVPAHHRVGTAFPSLAVLLLEPGDSACLASVSRT